MKATLTTAWFLALCNTIAAQELVSAADPEAVAALVQKLGFQAQLDVDNVGDPMIRSSSSGVPFTIYFYGCTRNRDCTSLQFLAGYDLAQGTTPDVIEAWNAEKRFASAYLDDENDPFLQMDVNTEGGGIAPATFESTLLLWQALKGEFEQRINFHGETTERPRSTSSTNRA